MAADPPKRIASVFLLPQCNMRCIFCASEHDFSVMSFEQADRLLDTLRRIGVRNVVFGGGEPLLWPHGLERLGRRARAKGLFVQLCTNGISLPEGFERQDWVDRFILPLESMEAGLHDELRRHGAGHHARVLDRIAALAGSGRELTVSTVVTRANVDGLREIAAFLGAVRDTGVALHAWHLYRFLPVGRGGTANAERLTIGRDRFRAACAAVRRQSSGFRVYRRDDMLRSSTVEFFWYHGDRLCTGSGRSAAALAPERAAAAPVD